MAVAVGGSLVIMNKKACESLWSSQAKVEHLIKLTSGLLLDLLDEDDGICHSPFNSNAVPSMPIPDFLRRVHKYTRFSSECLVLAIIYVDRYNLSQPAFTLSHRNIHKLMLTAILLAAKYQDDFYYDNKAFEFAGGVNALHLLQLELELFEKLDFRLFVAEDEF